MKHRAGSLAVVCAWMVILLQSLDAGHAQKKPAAGDSCRLKELTDLSKSLVKESLAAFDKANGEHLGNWSPGFPELQVHKNSPLLGSEVQCSLHFMTQSLEKILEDQKNNLNPTDVSLHEKLGKTISNVKRLSACAKAILKGECSQTPPSPSMPSQTFERKQWSHTLLKMASGYLDWLEHKLSTQISMVKGKKIMRKASTVQKYMEGSGYFL